jgi:hypothetical protein
VLHLVRMCTGMQTNGWNDRPRSSHSRVSVSPSLISNNIYLVLIRLSAFHFSSETNYQYIWVNSDSDDSRSTRGGQIQAGYTHRREQMTRKVCKNPKNPKPLKCHLLFHSCFCQSSFSPRSLLISETAGRPRL